MIVQRDVDLIGMNTLGTPCRASHFTCVADEQELEEAIRWAGKNGLRFFLLGEGSNVVLPARLNALVVRLVNRGISVAEGLVGEGASVDVCAGEIWHGLVESMLARGLYGLENLALIPGTVGAAPVQNIGAYGVELSRFVSGVRVLDTRSMEWLDLAREDCDFSYRSSRFRRCGQRYIISLLRLQLSHTPRVEDSYQALRDELNRRGIETATPRQIFDAVLSVRQSKLPDPADLPNAGSFFKNPVVDTGRCEELVQEFPDIVFYPQAGGVVKLAAAWLIERAGYKGLERKGISMHRQQALVLVNRNGADAVRVLAYAAEVESAVRKMFGLSLECEPIILDSDGAVVP